MEFMPIRPRRNRKSENMRSLVRETTLAPKNLVLPLFVQESSNKKTAIGSLPGVFRLSPDLVLKEAKTALELGIPAIALFPVIEENLKDSKASESINEKGLLPETLKMLKKELPELILISDVAMDPYSSDGHDGVVREGKIINDETLEILAQMAITQARAGADIVAPSDMMDGRVGHLRKRLDQEGFQEVNILAYSVKYASSLYGPFRDALDSAPKAGDKKTYQMDFCNQKEALREVELDIREGADMIMVKPALCYLDIISQIRDQINLPIAAYHVSGEYAMIKAASEKGWIEEKSAFEETLTSIKRAGADIIFTYYAKEMAKQLQA